MKSRRFLTFCFYKDLVFIFLLILGGNLYLYAGEISSDPHTLLLFHFNDTLASTDGTLPNQLSNIAYDTGIFNQGLRFNTNAMLQYAMPSGFNPAQGTVELWINPEWSGQEAHVMQIVHFGNIRIQINPGPFLKFILLDDDSEAWRGVELMQWQPSDWHHLAVTWEIPGDMKIYIDGVEKAFAPLGSQDLLSSTPSEFYIGCQHPEQQVKAILDEFRFSNIARTEQEIAQTVLAADFQVDSLFLKKDNIRLFPDWSHKLALTSRTSLGRMNFPNALLTWTSDDTTVAVIDSLGKITGAGTGSTTVRGAYNALSVEADVTVEAIARAPETVPVDSFLANPAPGYLYEMPVVMLVFTPTPDGIHAELPPGELPITVEELKTRILMLSRRTKFMLEEGSRFHGYKDSTAIPSLGYRVIAVHHFYEHMPQSRNPCGWNTSNHYPDYDTLFNRINAQNYVDNLGVKEFWVWYTGFEINGIGYELPESNMSSPLTGDISNSERRGDDLPVYNHTYCLYQYGWERLHCEAVHNHGHQLESILSYACEQQDGNNHLFVHDFMGLDSDSGWRPGHAGWTHVTANSSREYIYDTDTLRYSDIEDWRPDHSGLKKLVNVDTWRSIPYQWPSEPVWFGKDSPYDLNFSRAEAQWYIYWMQNMSGYQNQATYSDTINDGKSDVITQYGLTNWWLFTARWDSVVNAGLGLYEVLQTTGIEVVSQPDQFVLHPCYPNPFNPSTVISLSIPDRTRFGQLTVYSQTRIDVYNALGQKVDNLFTGKLSKGYHEFVWDASGFSSGVYFYVVETDAGVRRRKCLLLK